MREDITYEDVIKWIFALPAIGAGNSPVTGQRPVTRIFDLSFDLRLNKRLSKQPWDWWFETHRTHSDVTVMTCYLFSYWQIPRSAIYNSFFQWRRLNSAVHRKQTHNWYPLKYAHIFRVFILLYFYQFFVDLLAHCLMRFIFFSSV